MEMKPLDIEFKTLKNPYTKEDVRVAVMKGTEIWNPHKCDGEPSSSWIRSCKEAPIKDGNTSFHVDTNNPDGVLGKFPDCNYDISKVNLSELGKFGKK